MPEQQPNISQDHTYLPSGLRIPQVPVLDGKPFQVLPPKRHAVLDHPFLITLPHCCHPSPPSVSHPTTKTHGPETPATPAKRLPSCQRQLGGFANFRRDLTIILYRGHSVSDYICGRPPMPPVTSARERVSSVVARESVEDAYECMYMCGPCRSSRCAGKKSQHMYIHTPQGDESANSTPHPPILSPITRGQRLMTLSWA